MGIGPLRLLAEREPIAGFDQSGAAMLAYFAVGVTRGVHLVVEVMSGEHLGHGWVARMGVGWHERVLFALLCRFNSAFPYRQAVMCSLLLHWHRISPRLRLLS